MIKRRDWMQGIGGGLLGAAAGAEAQTAEEKRKPKTLDISEYEPRSMLRVHETKVERAKFPLIDIHTHLSWSVK
jgi:hypothetical protein